MSMEQMIETVRIAASDGATPEQKAAGVAACRTLLAALEAEAGKPIAIAGAPTAGPLAGIAPDQALDLLIAKLSAIAQEKEEKPAGRTTAPTSPLRIAFVPAPPRGIARARRMP